MKSLRQLTDELVGVRLNATNVSLWQQSVPLREAARFALNDAIAAFPARVEVVWTSAVVTGGVIALPKDVEDIIRVEAVKQSGTNRFDVRHWDIYATVRTTYLRLHDTVNSRRMEVTYTYKQPLLPADIKLVTDSGSLMTSTSRFAPANLWPSEGYYEMTEAGNDFQREVVQYQAVWHSEGAEKGGFQSLVRTIEGMKPTANPPWPVNSVISFCYVAPETTLRPVMLQAQASMYEFWLRNRAMYEQYTSLASMQALSLEDLQLLIRDLEGRARNARRHNRRLPGPRNARLRRPIPQ